MGFEKVNVSPREHDSEQRQEREFNSLPFSISPFVNVSDDPHAAGNFGLQEGELRLKVASKEPWTDLLLEVAMTTAFASLTDGIPILRQRALFSYLSFFILVWWIWASQVAYNLRFRQSDWLHRIYVFLQLGVFSALAAFTRDFDITAGFMQDGDQVLKNQLLLALGNDENTLQAIQFRDNRLPRLNARGVAVTMGLSRLLLLVQYAVVLYRGRHLKCRALVVHTVPLAFSSFCFFVSFLILGTGDGPVPKSIQIVKVLLWYGPMLLELSSYFLANELSGRVGYPPDGVIDRSGSVFIIILGGGLDKITTGFQFIVGNTGLAVNGVGLFVSAAVIFISQFSLYFGSPGGKRKLNGHRSMAWFFAHFFYLSALIMTLQGVATSLSFSNINHAIQTQLTAFIPTLRFMQNHPGVNLTASDFPLSQHTFEKLGLSFPGVVNVLNTNIELGLQQNDSNMANGAWLQQSINLIELVLEPFNAEPEPRSLLWAKLQIFLAVSSNDGARVNMVNWFDIYDGMVKSHGSSILWFFPVAGSTLIALAALSLIRGRPQDKLEWISVSSRLFVGFATIMLSMLDIGSSRPIIDGNGSPTSSMIWRLNWSNWILPIFALAVGGLQLIEFLLAYFARRSYHSFEGVPFWGDQTRKKLGDEPSHPYYQVAIPQKAFIVSAESHGPVYTQPYSFDAYGSYSPKQ